MECKFCCLKRIKLEGVYLWEKSGQEINGFYISQRTKMTENGEEYDEEEMELFSYFDCHTTSFEIKFCPKCGRKL